MGFVEFLLIGLVEEVDVDIGYVVWCFGVIGYYVVVVVFI